MLIRNTKRDIARVNTVLAERLRAGGSAPAAAAKPASDEAQAAGKAKTEKPAAKATKSRKPAKAAAEKET
jgi:hypothetical protein